MTPTLRRGPAPLTALAIGSFGIGMTEFVVMGLLPDLGVAMALIGLLLTAVGFTLIQRRVVLAPA